jgi:hypothetical protein
LWQNGGHSETPALGNPHNRPDPSGFLGAIVNLRAKTRNITCLEKRSGQARTPRAGSFLPRSSSPADDVNSLDSILKAIYDVISGPAGDRDWNRFRSLFVPEARLTSATRKDGGPVRLFDVEGYARGAGGYFKTHAFYESAIANRMQKFGNIAQVFSSYASRTAPNERPFARGVNSIQLFNDGSRWWVLSILWDEESPANPLPPDLATPAK